MKRIRTKQTTEEAEQTTQHIPQDCRDHQVAEGGDLADARPNTRKTARACGCAEEDHRFHLESCSPSVTPGERKEGEDDTYLVRLHL